MRALANRLLPRAIVRRLRRPVRISAGWLGWAAPADPALADLSGDGDWAAAGDAIALWARALCHVAPDANVLEIGCGPGRMAEGLLNWLDETGRYTGFDPSRKAIDAATRRLRDDRRARFEHADLFNAEYNPRGSGQADTYRFPAGDGDIDFVFATSVFTHMRLAGIRHYIAEAARVLKPGGAFLFTVFLVDEAARLAMATGQASYGFHDRIDDASATIDPKTPERAIAHERAAILAALDDAGLVVEDRVHEGTWRGSDHAMAFQDLIVARKPSS